MGITKPEEDIDIEIKKMNFIGFITDGIVSSEFLISEFGFRYTQEFVTKILNKKNITLSFHLVNRSKEILIELKENYSIEEYPELWL